ncbi:hypothetical protein HDU85_006177 [Gaertneriomyces sp. JEL0708]|nr:hypothetical protein HDU85_006177 [Gaertneriomyces sp. JEL0708]
MTPSQSPQPSTRALSVFSSSLLRALLYLQLVAVLAGSVPSSGLFEPPHFGIGSVYAEGKITVLKTNASCQDRLAAFGPPVSENGTLGFLTAASNLNAFGSVAGCIPVTPPSTSNWIALVQRGECAFVEKVRAMQKSGAKAVVVGDNAPHSGLITMFATGNTSDITIPAVFVSFYDFKQLLTEATIGRVENGVGVEVLMLPSDLDVPLLEIIVVTVIAPAAIICGMYAMWTWRQYVRRKHELAPVEAVLNLPTREFSREDVKENDPTRCAICLDDFREGDELRILPCKHEYHIPCVDKWLTQRKKTCPICKADTCPGEPSESTPLLGGHSSMEPGDHNV